MERDLSKYNELLSAVSALRNQRIDRSIELLKTIKPLSDELNNLRNEYGLQQDQKFNYFTLISDQYKKENLHSVILRALLDPCTFGKYDKRYLDVFLELLRSINSNIPKINFADNVSVERETGRIDIFIYDDTHGIIIENKINNAPNQDNQLARYVKFAKEKRIVIVAVVYIPPIDEIGKSLDLQYYSKKYKKYIDEIEEKLVILPVLESSKNDMVQRNDIVHGFLDEIEKIPADETARVFIKQYSNLLKGLGEKIMAMYAEIEILKKLLADEGIVEDIVKVWEKRYSLLFEVFSEKLRERLHFTRTENNIQKDINNDVFMYLGGAYLKDANKSYLDFGFGSKSRKMPEPTQKDLTKILKNERFQLFLDNFFETPDWVGAKYNKDQLKGSVDDMTETLLGHYRYLEDMAVSVLKSKEMSG
jgi:hypothetical protein